MEADVVYVNTLQKIKTKCKLNKHEVRMNLVYLKYKKNYVKRFVFKYFITEGQICCRYIHTGFGRSTHTKNIVKFRLLPTSPPP